MMMLMLIALMMVAMLAVRGDDAGHVGDDANHVSVDVSAKLAESMLLCPEQAGNITSLGCRM